MGKTANLRDYMADIALSNIRSGGSSSGGGELPEDYLYNLANIDAITLSSSSGQTVTYNITEETTSIEVTNLDIVKMGIQYKNGIILNTHQSSTGIDFNGESGSEYCSIFYNILRSPYAINCFRYISNSSSEIWSITIIVGKG